MPKSKGEEDAGDVYRQAAAELLESMGLRGAGMATADADMRVRSTLRRMAWQRAKGELNAMLETYWDAGGSGREGDEYAQVAEVVEKFMEAVEEVLT